MSRKLAVVFMVLALAVPVTAFADVMLRGTLTGFQENPTLSTPAMGKFNGTINSNGTSISWTLSYNDTESDVTQAHIHLGARGVNGGITVFLCTNLGNGPAGTQVCPVAPATISGTIAAADVSPDIPATLTARQAGLNTGEMAELVRALRSGATYANVHTTGRAGGELRGQIMAGFGTITPSDLDD